AAAGLCVADPVGVWDEAQLGPRRKAVAAPPAGEVRRVGAFIRRNRAEKFGPVRTVKPELVFELAFEGVERSSRHKSGLALRMPRILRRGGKGAQEAGPPEQGRKLRAGGW